MYDHRAQVVEPKVRAYLYTWGDGRHTAEGEFIPVRTQSSPCTTRLIMTSSEHCVGHMCHDCRPCFMCMSYDVTCSIKARP